MPLKTITVGDFPHNRPSWKMQRQAQRIADNFTLLGSFLDGIGVTVDVAIAASATTDGMDITVTVKDADGATVAAVHELEMWMSDAATGIGLTSDTYSGDLTAGTGAILTALTSKKHWTIVTAATGIFVGTLVDSANPTDQYVAVRKPIGGALVVSDVSGTNWQGAS